MKATALALVLLIALPTPFFAMSRSVEPDVVLVTGFEPFGRWERNPSGEIALALNDTMVGDVRIVGLMLPVTFNTSYQCLREAVVRYDPAAVIALGLDGAARSMEVERLAVNLQRPAWLRFLRINTSGSLFRGTMLPGEAIVAALRDDGIAARQSWFAGLYVCNHVFYRLLGDAGQWDIPAGFIHVPPTPSQEPYGMEPGMMLRGVRAAVNVTMAA